MTDAVKAEDGLPMITKTEPDSDEVTHPLDDDEGYEDTGELEMPKELPKAWLTKVPRHLYENWAAINDDEPVSLGYVRRFKKSGKCRLVLHSASKYNQRVPLEYDMRMQEPGSGSTYIFSEKDIPEVKNKAKLKKAAVEAQPQKGVNKNDKYRSWRRRVVPKQTTLAASVTSEVACSAVENDFYRRITAQRIAEEQANKPSIQLLSGDARIYGNAVLPSEGKVSRPSAIRAEGGFDTFVKPGVSAKPRVQQQKAARIAHNELLDLIFDQFKLFKYYHFQTLRNNINQPQDYLRNTLLEVADLVRSGPFYGTYALKNDFEDRMPPTRLDQVAPGTNKEGEESGGEDNAGDDDNDDDVEMEDVYPA